MPLISYTIQPLDTPASVAAKFGVTPDKVRWPVSSSQSFLGLEATGMVAMIDSPLSPGNPTPTSSTTNTGSGSTNTAAATDTRGNTGGFITFHIMTEQGVSTVPIRFDNAVWTALINSPLYSKWGLMDEEPQVQIGRSQEFIKDLTTLPPAVKSSVDSAVSSLTYFEEVDPSGGGDIPALSPEMIQSGIMWAKDPATGEYELIDTQPLVGPSLSAFRFTPTNPNDPNSGGSWVVVPDLASEERSIYEGVPSSVEPWLQLALDNGGNYNVVPEGPARSWVKYLLDQVVRSSSRQPGEQPFGVGLPNFPGGKPGQTTPVLNPGGSISAAPALPNTPNATNTPGGGGFAGTPIGKWVEQFFINEGIPYSWDEQEAAKNQIANVSTFADQMQLLFSPEYQVGNIGLSGELFNGGRMANTPMGRFYQYMADNNILRLVPNGAGGMYIEPVNRDMTPWVSDAPAMPTPETPAPTTSTTPYKVPTTGSASKQTPEQFAQLPDFVQRFYQQPTFQGATPTSAPPPPAQGTTTPQPSAEPTYTPAPPITPTTVIEPTKPVNSTSNMTPADFNALPSWVQKFYNK